MVHLDGRRRESLSRINLLIPLAPGNPPSRPYGTVVRRSDRILTLAGTRTCKPLRIPLPPLYFPLPPEFKRNLYRITRSGNSVSKTSIGVFLVFAICVCTPSSPLIPDRAPI